MQTKDHAKELANLNKQIAISNVIDVIMKQSLQLMEIVNQNQKEINDLKADQDKLKSAIKGQEIADELTSSNDVKGGW